MGSEFGSELLGSIDQETAADAAIIFDCLEQLLLVLFSHAGQFADFPFPREFFDAIQIADLEGAPNQGDGLRPEALDFEQLEHGRTIFLEQLGVDLDVAFLKEMLQVGEHAFADAGNCEQLLGLGDQVGDLLRHGLDGLGGVAVGTNAEGILAVDFEQVGGLVEDAGDGFVVHGRE